MKYYAFYGSEYYAVGGAKDFVGFANSVADAKSLVLEAKSKNGVYGDDDWEYEWGHIADENMNIVWRAECE